MASSPKRKESVASRNLREQYSRIINSDAALVEARRWIERATFTPFKNDDFRESLRDGVLLCELIVNVANFSVGRINKQNTSGAAKDNLGVFFRACEALEFEKYKLFDFEDLEEPPIKRGQTAADRARESQKRLGKVALTIYWLGKYAIEELSFTGRLVLDEECFTHLLEGEYPPLPEIEPPPLIRQQSAPNLEYKPQYEILDEQKKAASHEIEKTDVEKVARERKEAFRRLEQQAIQEQQEEAEERQRRRSFSGKENRHWQVAGDREDDEDEEEKLKRRKSVGAKTTDPIRARRERIVQSVVEPKDTDTSPKQPIQMKASVNLREKRHQFEAMERQASEEAEVLHGKRVRPKSWAGDLLSRGPRGGSLKDRTLKYDSLQYQADKESALLHGELRMPVIGDDKRSKAPVLRTASVKLKDKQSKYEQLDKKAEKEASVLQGAVRQNSVELYDIGDKPNTVVPLPAGSEIQLRDKRHKFESLDYNAQRESSILKLKSGKSFDNLYHDPIPLSTSTRRAEPKPRPKSDYVDYFHYRGDESQSGHTSRDVSMESWRNTSDVDMRESWRNTSDVETREEQIKPVYSAPRESGRTLDELMGTTSPSRSLSPPPRGDSLRYSPVGFQRNQTDPKEKHPNYSSFAAAANTEKKTKTTELQYKDFVVPPTTKQVERVERYNAALEDLAKEPESKTIIDHNTGAPPRRKSQKSTGWIKVTSAKQEPKDNVQKPIKKLWDREPQQDSDEENNPPPSIPRYNKPAVEVSTNSYQPDVKGMRYSDFAALPLKTKSEPTATQAYVAKVEVKPQTSSEPFKRFTPPVVEPSRGGKVTTLTYKDFAAPPSKVANVLNEQPPEWKKETRITPAPVRKRSVKDISSMFTDMEKDKDRPKSRGPPPPKSLVDREELIRYERESRARSWYGGPLGLDDDEYEASYRRQVRRWSDYGYEEDDRLKPAPYDNDSSYYEEHKRDDVFETSSKPTSPPRSPPTMELEIEPEAKPVVESSREWNSFHDNDPDPGYQSIEHVSYATKYEPRHETSRPVKSILKTQPEPVHDYYHVESPEPQPEPSPPRSMSPQSPPHRSPPQESFTSRVGVPEPEPPARPPLPNYRAIGGRSWQDFETSTRKKSMELLNRPSSRVFEPPPEPVRAEVVKLRRPADYMPRHGSQELLNGPRPTSPTYRPTSPPTRTQPPHQQPQQEDHQYYYESKPSAHDHYPDTRTEDPHKADLPVTYPTYYKPEERTPEPRRPVSVETSKPLLVNAKVREEDQVVGAIQRRSPSHEFVVAEKHHVVERQPEAETRPRSTSPRPRSPASPRNEPKSTLDVGNYAFRPRSPQPHTWQPTGRASSPRQEQKSAPKEDLGPQIFAIVGQGKAVRPVAAEIPKPVKVVREEYYPPREEAYYKRHHEDVQIPAVEQAVHDVSLKMEEKFRDEESSQRKPKTFELSKETETKTFELKDERQDPLAAYNARDQSKNIEITTTTHVRKEEVIPHHHDEIVKSPGRPEMKVFDFRSQSPVVKATDEKEPEQKRAQSPLGYRRATSPVMKVERQIVVESFSAVQKEPTADVDVTVLEKSYEEDKQEHNLRDADYRVKLRKEVEETNKKQREDARYLMNHMRASLGSDEDLRVKEEKERLRKEQEEQLKQAEETKESLHGLLDELGDFKAKKNDDMHEEKPTDGYEDHKPREGYHDRSHERYDDRSIDRHSDRSRDSHEERSRDGGERSRERQDDRSRGRYDDRRDDRPRDRYDDRRSRERPDERPRDRRDEKPRDRPDERPRDRRDERPDERRRERPDERPRDRRDEKPRERPDERPRDRRDERPREKPEERPRDRRDERPRERPDERPRERPDERPRDKRDERPRERPDERPRDRRDERPRERPDERPRDRRDERPRERPDERPRDRRDERPRERPDERPRDRRDERPRERPDDRPRDRRDERPRERPEERPRDRREERPRERPDERVQVRSEERPLQNAPERFEERRDQRPSDDDDHVGSKGMQRWHGGDDINGNYQEEGDLQVGEMNGISPVDKEHHGKFDNESENKIQWMKEAEQQRVREAEEELVERQEAKMRIIHASQQQQVRTEETSRDESRYGVDNSMRESEWVRIRDGSEYSIYESYIHGDRNHVVCACCGEPIRKSVAIYVSEMKRYWHDQCFQCVVCHVRFGSTEQRSPMKVTSSLLHCENCFITDEGERCTEV